MLFSPVSLIFLTAFLHCVFLSLQLSGNLESRVDDYLEEIMADPYYHQPALKFEVEKLFQEYKDYIGQHVLLGTEQSITVNSTVELPVNTFKDFTTVPVPFPFTIQLFTEPDSSVIYAVSLEVNDNPQNTDLMEMVLRKYDEIQDLWIVCDSMLVRNGAQLEIQNIDGYIFTFLSSNNIVGEQQINSFLISNSKFHLSQTFNIGKIDCFTVWEEPNSNNIYLGVVINSYNDPTSRSLYLYQWTNDNFVLFDITLTLCSTAMKSFYTDDAVFLAVCHGSDVSSVIGAANHTTLFKFDDETKSFDVHQIIPVSNGMDMEYFEFQSNSDLVSEQFLIFVSRDGEEQRSSTSMAYKFCNGYFYPFQIFDVNDVFQWLVFESSDQSFLLAATKFSGVRAFCYDGRAFAETSVNLEFTFIDGVSKCLLIDTTVLVITDRGNDGTHPNVFYIPPVNGDLLDETEDMFNEWYAEMEQQLEHMTQLDHLEEIIRSAPRVDSPEIIINGTLEFSVLDGDELILVHSSQDSSNDTKQEQFAENLENKLTELKMIESFVHKLVSSNGKFIVNGDLFLNEFAVNCTEECDLNILSISNLNGEDFDDLVANTINIDTPSSFDASFEFENIAVSLHLLPEFINQHPLSSLVHRNRDVLFRNGLKLNSVVVSEKLNVKGLIDGVRMEPDLVLLVSGDQNLNGTLIFEKGKIDELYYDKSLAINSESCFGEDHNN